MRNETNKQSMGLSISLIIYYILASIIFILTFHYAGIDPDEPLDEHDVPYEVDKPIEEQDVPYQVSIIARSCSSLERGGNFAKCLNASTQEDLKDPNPDGTVREYVSNIIQ